VRAARSTKHARRVGLGHRGAILFVLDDREEATWSSESQAAS